MALLSSGLLLASSASWGELPKKPNVIFFLVDDLGWMDTAAYGSAYYKTPNIDRLAARGMLFTDAYAASPVCSPTRASILTGKYPARLGITEAVGHRSPLPAGASRYADSSARRIAWIAAASLRYLPLEEETFAEALKASGYRTAHVGKWHLGVPPQYWPEQQGFDVSIHGAPDAGVRSYFSPYGFPAGTLLDGPKGEYVTDRLTDEALQFIEANRDRPFLLDLWHFGVHGPWGFKEALEKEFEGRKDPRGQQDDPIMAAMIQSIDESVGRVLDKIDELGLTDRTVFFLFSDNGGAMHVRIGAGRWLPTNNSPLRGAKGLLYEGGIRVPLIVSWPGVVPTGSRNSEVVSSVDFYPTILELAGVTLPPPGGIDGESLLPLLTQSGHLRREAVYNYYPFGSIRAPGGATIRQGRWKLIRWFGTSPWFPKQLELYDLEQDIEERTNVALDHPDLTRRLDSRLDQFLTQTVAFPPEPSPSFDPEIAALGAWLPHQVPIELKDGVLRLFFSRRPEGEWGGVRLDVLNHPTERGRIGGPWMLELRVRSLLPTLARVRTLGARKGQAVSQSTEFAVEAGSKWQEVRVGLMLGAAPVELGLEFDGKGDIVEIDDISLRAATDDAGWWPAFRNRMDWTFDLPSSYVGSIRPDDSAREPASAHSNP